jgi:hypothetical protein
MSGKSPTKKTGFSRTDRAVFFSYDIFHGNVYPKTLNDAFNRHDASEIFHKGQRPKLIGRVFAGRLKHHDIIE